MVMRNLLQFALLYALAEAQFQPPPDQQQQQQQFGMQQGNIDPRQQQFQGGQQQQFPAQFGSGQQQGVGAPGFPGQQQPMGSGFGPVSPNQPLQPVDAFGVPQNPNQMSGGQQQPNQFGGPGVQQGQFPQQTFGGGPLPAVKITTDLLSVDLAQHTDKLLWSEPRSDVIYCVSAAPVQRLFWHCFDCNGTFGQQWANYLSQQTFDFQQTTGYPSIRLNQVAITGELHMKTLGCVAVYGTAPNGAPLNTTVTATIVLQYLSTPVIVDQQAHGPLYMNPNDGYQFYVPQQSRFTLHCLTQGNPPPTAYNWTVNGAPAPNAGNSPQLGVDAQSYAGKAVSCRVYSQAYPHGKESAPVGIMTWIPPTLTSNNFQDLQRQGGLFEQGTSNVQLDKSMTLQCGVTGLPIPWIWWRQEVSPGHIINATCDGGRQDTAPALSPNGYAVASQCAVRIDSYDKTGRYWCSGCNYLSAGTYQCIPEERQVSSSSVRIDVIGRPLVSHDEPPRYERAEEVGSVKIGVPYCANPEPSLPDGVYWQINGQRLNLRNEIENYYAEAPEQNATVPNCWIARLRIRQVSDADKSKNFKLTVVNQVGTVSKEFQLSQLNSTSSSYDEDGRVGLAVGLTLGLFFLILLIACAFCWWRKLLCFGKMDRRQSPSQTKQPPKQTKDKYQTNVVPDTIRTTPGGLSEKVPPTISSRPAYDVPPSEPAHGNGSSPSGRRKHEGLNYAELDLVKDSHRPLQPTPAPAPTSTYTQGRPPGPDYSRFQPSTTPTSASQLKSPTNSTV